MDQRLIAWGRAVKARRPGPPPLWLFTDFVRMPDAAAAAAALPCGLCGIVFRHDGAPGRRAMLRRLAVVCRARRLALVVAGDPCDAPAGVGRHLRSGTGPRAQKRVQKRAHTGLTTASAHNVADLVKGQRAGADLAVLSPVFDTVSHPGTHPLGPLRWSRMARSVRIPVFALGGMTGSSVRRLPRWAAGAAAIGALSP